MWMAKKTRYARSRLRERMDDIVLDTICLNTVAGGSDVDGFGEKIT